MTRSPLLTVDGLSVSFPGGEQAVRDVSFDLEPGECLAIVGESGSGKSVTARSLLGLAGPGARVSARRLEFDGTDLTTLGPARWRGLRGRRIALVHQDALVALDPLRRVGAEVAETLVAHRSLPSGQVPERVVRLLEEAGVPEPELRARQYPHELSGGLRQRALIASAIAAGPDLLLADEPTTALDVTVQAQVLELLRRRKREGTALLLVSHDLAVVAGLADRVAVMHGGRIVEQGPAASLTRAPRHRYTRTLLAAVPAPRSRGARLSPGLAEGPAPDPDGCSYAARCPLADDRCRRRLPDGGLVLCWHPGDGPVRSAATAVPLPLGPAPRKEDPPLLSVEGVTRRFRSPDGSWRDAVRDVSFTLRPAETLGVVGESGSGKTSTARIALGLLEPDEGAVRFSGRPWSGVPERARRALRPRIQAVYQDPLGSFDPRFTVGRIIAEAAAAAGRPQGRDAVTALLDQVRLPSRLLGRRPLELSGGQRQRVAIARALATSPEVLVCDEPVSALDVSVQAQILDLLADLRRDLGLALLFISHDLGVIAHVSDRILVMKDGRVVESGPAEAVFEAPGHPYTRELLAAVPRVDPDPDPARTR